MQEDEYKALAKARLDRAEELLDEAESLLERSSFKSANNRAYYAIEKSLLALLTVKHIQTQTHNGCLMQFNIHYVNSDDNDFSSEDYKLVSKAEKIRNASDYDDFYIADKKEAQDQVDNARYILNKINTYLESRSE